MLKRWVVTGPEISRVIEQFITVDENDSVKNILITRKDLHLSFDFNGMWKIWRSSCWAMEIPLRRWVKTWLYWTTRCESAAAALSIHQLESTGKKQYTNFRKSVLESCDLARCLWLIVIDGGVLIHSLPGTTVEGKTFDSYFDKVSCPRVHYELEWSTRVDIIWNQYRELTIKGGTREKRGKGTWQGVSGMAIVPGDWQKFLAHFDDKKELFSFLSNMLLTD